MNYQLPKSTKLHHRTLINNLFDDGTSLYAYPLRLIYREFSKEKLATSFCKNSPTDIDNMQFMITIPKKKQRRAVNRVLLRRRIREAYRLCRPELTKRFEFAKGEDHYLSLAFIYLSDDISNFDDIKAKMNRLLEKLFEKTGCSNRDEML